MTSSVTLVWNTDVLPTSSVCMVAVRHCSLEVRTDGNWNIAADRLLTDVGIRGTFAGIPEPGTLALFGLGLAGLGIAWRKMAA